MTTSTRVQGGRSLLRPLVAALIGLLHAVLLLPGTAGAAPALTPQGVALGFSLSQFADEFPTLFGVGPVGVVFPAGGSVLVSDYPGSVRIFPSDTDGQHASSVVPAQNYGPQIGQLAIAGGKVYLVRQALGDLLQLNEDGTFNQFIVGGMPAASALIANPANGHLFVSTLGTNVVFEVDPIAKTATPFVFANVDGLTITPDGSILYGVGGGIIFGWNTATAAEVFNSGFIPGGPDGISLGFGTLAGNIFANTNSSGEVIEINLSTKVQTVIVNGGSRGDFVIPDPNGSLLFTQTSDIWRLIPPPGGCFGGNCAGAAVKISKEYRSTDVCFIAHDPLACPKGTSLGTALSKDPVSGNFLIQPVVGKDGLVNSYNPGQYYAVIRAQPLTDLGDLFISERFGSCTEGATPLSALNPKLGQGGGSVLVIDVGPDGVAHQIADANSAGIVTVGDLSPVNGIADSANAHLTNVSASHTYYLYVKFGPGLKGFALPAAPNNTCQNFSESRTQMDVAGVTASAVLQLGSKR